MRYYKCGLCGKTFDVAYDDYYSIHPPLWQYNQAPIDPEIAANLPSPKEIETWKEFAIKDGFTEFQEFLEFFDPVNHPKQKSKYIFFEFQKDEEYYSKNYKTLEGYIKNASTNAQ